MMQLMKPRALEILEEVMNRVCALDYYRCCVLHLLKDYAAETPFYFLVWLLLNLIAMFIGCFQDMSPAAVAFGQDRMMNLLNEYVASPLSELGMYQLFISIYCWCCCCLNPSIKNT